MSEPASSYPPPADLAASPVVAALSALPAGKQAEILWRLAAALDSGNERQVQTLLRALRGLAEPSSLPRCDPATAQTVTVEAFRAAFEA